MSRSGYLQMRMTPPRRQQLDTLRQHFGRKGKTLSDTEAVDFAVAFTIAALPDRLTQRRATPVLNAVKNAARANVEWTRAMAPQTSRIRIDDGLRQLRKRGADAG